MRSDMKTAINILRELTEAADACANLVISLDDKALDNLGVKANNARKFIGTQTNHIVVLCGSTRFVDAYREANKRETLLNHIVLTCGYFGNGGDGLPSPELREKLNTLHRAKINMADEVVVVTENGYIGETTSLEIDYAKSLKKPIRVYDHKPGIVSVNFGTYTERIKELYGRDS